MSRWISMCRKKSFRQSVNPLQFLNLPFPVVESHFYKFVNYKSFIFCAKINKPAEPAKGFSLFVEECSHSFMA